MIRTTSALRLLPALALGAPLSLPAAVPLRWTAETSRAAPVAFEQFAGTSIGLEAALTSYGRPLAVVGEPRLYWQTNGMGSTWWSAPASASGNVLRATWTPACEAVGATSYRGFVGVPGSVYSAAFTLRLRPSPGAVPNALPLPAPRIDFAAIEVANAPWVEEESDPTVPAWAKAAVKPKYTATEVGAVPTSRTVNGKALSADVTLGAADIGAYTKTQTDTAISSALAAKADKSDLAAVTNAVREAVRETGALFWDAELEVTWQGRFEGGYLYYVPVTNVNVTGRD